MHLFIHVIISDLRLHNQLLFFFFISNRYSDKAASIPNHWHPITLKGEIGVKVCKNFLCHNHSGGFCLILSKKYGVCNLLESQIYRNFNLLQLFQRITNKLSS